MDPIKSDNPDNPPAGTPQDGAASNPLPLALQDAQDAKPDNVPEEDSGELIVHRDEPQPVEPAQKAQPDASQYQAPLNGSDADAQEPTPPAEAVSPEQAAPATQQFQSSLQDAQAIVEAQIEAAAQKFDAGSPAAVIGDPDTDGSASALPGAATMLPAEMLQLQELPPAQDLQPMQPLQPMQQDQQPTQPDAGMQPGQSVVGQGSALEESQQYQQPLPPQVPLQPMPGSPQARQPIAASQMRRRNYRKLLGAGMILGLLLLVVGIGAFSVWYVQSTVAASVKYTNYQPVSVKGENDSGGFTIEVPAEYSQDNKSANSVEYSHRVPSTKGSGNYSGIAVNTSTITGDNQLGEVDKLKTLLRDKNSAESEQFVALINGSLSGQQQVALDEYIEKTSSSGQAFFGYEVTLNQDSSEVGKGWMLITTTNKHIYVLVMYGTSKVWEANPNAWQHIFDSMKVAAE